MNDDNKQENNMNYIQRFKPHYLQVSDQIFKQMLSNAIPDGDKIVQCLNTNTILV
jgi:hypothetical protein